MALRDQPYLPLYVQDFISDEKLAECSASATGVYIRLMCIMHKSEEYGKFCYNKRDRKTDNKIHDFSQKLVKQMPYSFDVIYDGLCELLDLKILQISGEKLIQKRMVKDSELSEKRAKSGKKGMETRWKSDDNGNKICYNKQHNKKITNTENESEDEIENKDDVTNEDKGGMGENKKPLTWKDDFNIYVDELREAYNLLIRDKEFLDQQQKYHPNLNIKLTLEKACVNFWATEAGWTNKKKTKTKTINWKTTLTNSLSQTQNKVYYERENGNSKNSKSAVSDSYKAEILRAMGVIPSTGDV